MKCKYKCKYKSIKTDARHEVLHKIFPNYKVIHRIKVPMDNFRVYIYKHNSTLRDISDLVGGKKGKWCLDKKRENDCWTIMKRWDSEEKAILPGNFQFSDKANTLCLFLDQPFCSTIVFSETTNIIISSTFALFFRRRIDNKDVSSSSSAWPTEWGRED